MYVPKHKCVVTYDTCSHVCYFNINHSSLTIIACVITHENLTQNSFPIHEYVVTSLTLVQQELLMFPEHLSSPYVSGALEFASCFRSTWVHLIFPEHLSSPYVSGPLEFASCFRTTWVRLMFPEHLSSPHVVSEVRVTQSVVFCEEFCGSCLYICPFPFVLLPFTTSDYPFCTFKPFFFNNWIKHIFLAQDISTWDWAQVITTII